MKNRSRFVRLSAAVLAAVLLCTGSGLSAAAATRTELEAQIKELQEKADGIKKELSAAKTDLSASQQRKNLIDAQISNAEQQIALYNSQINAVQAQVDATQQQIAEREQEIAAQEASILDTKEKLSQRLRAIMKSGNVTTLQMLLNTESYTDYLLKSKAMHCIAEKDQNTIDELEAKLTAIREEKTALEAKKTELSNQKADIEALRTTSTQKKKELDTLCAAAQTEVRNLSSTVDGYNSQLSDTQKKIEEANQEITRLIQNSSSTGKYDGKMMYWPVPTVRALSDVFGPRWGKMHRGIDIANGPIPIYGENIVAAADGTVIAANYTSYYGTGWSYGYGYSCIVDHGYDSQGRKITTLYAHCSVMNARVGQKVTGGKTVLGQAGKSGDVTGPHLHFEVRVNGVAVDPLNTYVSPNVN